MPREGALPFSLACHAGHACDDPKTELLSHSKITGKVLSCSLLKHRRQKRSLSDWRYPPHECASTQDHYMTMASGLLGAPCVGGLSVCSRRSSTRRRAKHEPGWCGG